MGITAPGAMKNALGVDFLASISHLFLFHPCLEQCLSRENRMPQHKGFERTCTFASGDLLPRLHTGDEFLCHRLECAVPSCDCFFLEVRCRKQLDEALEATETIVDAGTTLFILRTRASRMDPERPTFLHHEVHIGMEEAAKGVFLIEELRHVFCKASHCIPQSSSEEDVARFTDEVRVQFSFDPHVEELFSTTFTFRHYLATCAEEFFVEMFVMHLTFVLVAMVH